MEREKCDQTPTDEEILSYTNVPLQIASAYVGQGVKALKRGLIQKTVPFGYAVENQETGTYTFQISPGLLVNYQRGVLNGISVKGAVEIMTAEIERLLSARSRAALEVLAPGLLETNKGV